MTYSTYGRIQGFFVRPSCVFTPQESLCMYAFNEGPIFRTKGVAVQSQQNVSPGIACLDIWRSPIGVFWGIRGIVVAAFQAMVRAGAWPHVLIKRFKRGSPGLTDSNPTASIAFKAVAMWVVAAFFHFCPNTIFRCIRLSMRAKTLSVFFLLITPTTQALPRREIPSNNDTARATDALTPPLGGSIKVIMGTLKNKPLTKRVISQIYKVVSWLTFTLRKGPLAQPPSHDSAYRTAGTLTFKMRTMLTRSNRTFKNGPIFKCLSSEINQRHAASLQAKGRWSGPPQVRLRQLTAREAPDNTWPIIPQRMVA